MEPLESRLVLSIGPTVMDQLLASVPAGAGNLAITELNYNPYDPSTPAEASFLADDFEFVELRNTSAGQIDLTGVHFTAGVSYTFPGVTLDPGQFIVAARDPSAFQARYGVGRLSNSGEDVELQDAQGGRVDVLHFADEGDWSYRIRGPLDNNHRGLE